ncbi:MAG TPA: molybdopterin cofactor-binding domain-containing protein [Gaiellaceae bacterium]|nr:molybdopterin cofactor-binding domain-containing protein [Gaiellaceae bacterium]
MTGLIQEKAFSRRSFLKGSGALVVGFSLTGVAAKAAGAADGPFSSNAPYNPNAIDSFIAIHGDNTVTLKSGRVEIGQGTSTGLLMVAAEELNVDLAQMHWVNVDTNVTPDTGGTYGSSSIKSCSPQCRAAAAFAKQALLGLASTNLGVPVANLTVASGVVSGGGKTVTYGQLLGDKTFSTNMGAVTLTQFQSPAKSTGSYSLVGTAPPRIDIPAKVTGTYVYVHNVRLPGMLHARIVRPRGQGAYGTGAPIVSIDTSSIAHIPNVRVLRKADFLAVVAPLEYNAIQAAAQLKVTWKENPLLPGNGNITKQMRAQYNAGQTTATAVKSGNPDGALASAAKVLTASYTINYNSHAPIGPTCCLADVTPQGAVIYTSSQDSYVARGRTAAVLGLPVNLVRFRYYEGGGAFGGHPGRYDAPPAVGLISQLAGAPVRLQYMRWDEQGWDAYGPTTLEDVQAGIDSTGKIVAYQNTRWNLPTAGLAKLRETTEELLGMPMTSAQAQAQIPGASLEPGVYVIPNQANTSRAVPFINGGYLKQAPIRQDVTARFATEQMIDELAYAAGMDPIDFRILNMSAATNSRDINALMTAKQISGWVSRPAASKLSKANVVTGRGVATTGATGAVVAEITVNRTTGKIVATQMFGAQDVGLAINPGLVMNQMSGSLTQTSGRTIYEGVAYNRNRVTGLDFVTYPLLRFKEAPKVTTVVIQRMDQVSSGAGEPLVPGTPPAIANAFFDATGVRIRNYPLDPGQVRALLAASKA